MSELPPHLRAMADQVNAAISAQEGDDFERLQENLLSIQVCTSLDDEAATSRMNLTPPGTSHGWQLDDDPTNGPVPCSDKPNTHRHLVFVC